MCQTTGPDQNSFLSSASQATTAADRPAATDHRDPTNSSTVLTTTSTHASTSSPVRSMVEICHRRTS